MSRSSQVLVEETMKTLLQIITCKRIEMRSSVEFEFGLEEYYWVIIDPITYKVIKKLDQLDIEKLLTDFIQLRSL